MAGYPSSINNTDLAVYYSVEDNDMTGIWLILTPDDAMIKTEQSTNKDPL